ncbi:MAG: HIT family protein [Sulfolobaceae archaeon]
MNECVFCRIVRGELKSFVVYEDEDTLAFLDIYPISKGHTLVIPKSHFENIFDIDYDVLKKVITTVRKVSLAMRKLGAEGVNVILNNGKAAEQHVFHIHFHVIPRYNNDGLNMDILARRIKYDSMEEMRETAIKINRVISLI